MVFVDDLPELFRPFCDQHGWVSEDPLEYAARMRDSLLPMWPEEVLVEWLHRHHSSHGDYSWLDFTRFRFSREVWPLAKIPGREAFADPSFCDDFQDLARRATDPYDWLARYMNEHGTWNTPIVILHSPPGDVVEGLKHPLHLLEGHRRLSFLNALRSEGRALPNHSVWVVKLSGEGEKEFLSSEESPQ